MDGASVKRYLLNSLTRFAAGHVQPAGGAMVRADLDQRRHLNPAAVEDKFTARRKWATFWLNQEVRRGAGDGAQALIPAAIDARQGPQQSQGIGVARVSV